MQRLVPRLAAAVFVLLPFVACDSAKQTVVDALTIGSSPQGTEETAETPPIDSSRLIYVVPVEGVNGPGRMVLADAIAAQLRDADKPAVLAEHVNEKGPTVAGTIEKVEQHDSVVWVTAVWALKAPYGTAVAEYREQIVVDAGLWQRGSAEAINLLAADAGPAVAAMIADYISPVAMAPAPPAPDLTSAASAGAAGAAPPAAAESAPPPMPVPPAAAGRAPPPGAAVAEAPTSRFQPPSPPGRPKPPSGRVAEAAPRTVPESAPRSVPESVPQSVPESAHVKPLVASAPAAEARPKALTAPKPQAKPMATAKKKAEPVLMPVPEDKPKAKPPETGRETPRQTASQAVRDLAEKRAEQKARKKKADKILMPVPEHKPSRLVPDPPPVSWGRPSFLIKPVRGAPGDGNKALVEAMKAALRKRDLTVTEDPRQAGFVIEGRVELSAPIDGRQHAKIVWAVNTIAGDEVGKAVQENAVKAGSLNGPWGRVAVIVSNAAVVGIQELFGIEEKQSSLNAPPADFSNMPDLPRVPGRAPPPPK